MTLRQLQQSGFDRNARAAVTVVGQPAYLRGLRRGGPVERFWSYVLTGGAVRRAVSLVLFGAHCVLI